METLWNTAGKSSFNTPSAFHISVVVSHNWDAFPVVRISAHLAEFTWKLESYKKGKKFELIKMWPSFFSIFNQSPREYQINVLCVCMCVLNTYFASVVLLAFSMFFKLSGDRSWNRQLSFMFQTDSINTPTLGIPALIEKATAPAW